MHPDLKLGLVLAAAAVLLGLGNPGRLLAAQAVQRLDISASSYGLLLAAGGVGGLAVIASAIWVDRRPPHTMMAAGPLVALLGISLLVLPASMEAYVVGMFIAGVGSAAVDPLIFYAVVVRGAARYRGALIGFLGIVFLYRPNTYVLPDWPIGEFALFMPVMAAFALVGATLLYVTLPRVYTGAYEPEQTLLAHSGTPSMPSIRRALIWVTIAYFAASMATITTDLYLPGLTAQSTSELDSPGLAFLTTLVLHTVSAAGFLLWGAASDFLAIRRWLLLAAPLYLLLAGVTWMFDGLPMYAVGLVAAALVKGGLVCLPWVLMAELLPTRHFAKLAFLIQFVGGVAGSILGGLLLTVFLEAVPLIFLVLVVEALALAVIAALLPRRRSAKVVEE